MSTELLNCPFCGHQMAPKLISTTEWRDEFDMHYEGEDGNVECFAVMCNASKPSGPGGCGASGGFHETRVAAIAAWNRRAATGPLWSVFNTGAEVAGGLTFAKACAYMTPERIARGWTMVSVVMGQEEFDAACNGQPTEES